MRSARFTSTRLSASRQRVDQAAAESFDQGADFRKDVLAEEDESRAPARRGQRREADHRRIGQRDDDVLPWKSERLQQGRREVRQIVGDAPRKHRGRKARARGAHDRHAVAALAARRLPFGRRRTAHHRDVEAVVRPTRSSASSVSSCPVAPGVRPVRAIEETHPQPVVRSVMRTALARQAATGPRVAQARRASPARAGQSRARPCRCGENSRSLLPAAARSARSR